MNQPILVALISVSGVIVGAALSFLASYFTAKQRIKVLELTYNQKLDETYLTNARNYLKTVYMPINIGLSSLESHYYHLKTIIGSYDKDTEEFKQAIEEFRRACDGFNELIFKLINQGEDAYLTSKLEISLRSFNNFVKNSKNTKKHSLSTTGKIRLRLIGFERSAKVVNERELSSDEELKLLEGIQDIKPITRLLNSALLNLYGLILWEMNVIILAAPVTSLAFERRINSDIPMLKAFIKEISLGTTPLRVAQPS